MTALFISTLIAEIVLAFIAIGVESTPLYLVIGYAIPLTVLAYIAISILRLV